MNDKVSTKGSKSTSKLGRRGHQTGTPASTPSTAPAAKRQSKQQLLADLLARDSGATLDEMVSATGWLPHTTRAALTGLKKKGYAITSDKVDGMRTYHALAPQ